jgi:cytochrome c-type biogenesis protein CcmH/NrfG
MMRTREQRPAGVPDDLAPEQLERWSNGLVAFLSSDDVPQQFRAWARDQAGLVDAWLASAADLDGDEVEDDRDEAPDESATGAAAVRAPRQRRSVTSEPEPRGFALRVPEQTGKLILGIIAGAALLLVIVGARQMMSGGGDGADALPAGAEAIAFDQARADELEALLQQDPANKDALFELGEMNFQAQRYEDMIPWFTKLVELDPANKHALTDLGTAHFNLGQPTEARIWWEKVLAVDPIDVQAHYNLGFMFANAEPRDLAAAVSEWESVLRLDPTSQLAETARLHIDGLKAELAAASAPTSVASPPVAVTP